MTTEEYRLVFGVFALLACMGLLAIFAWISNTRARARGRWPSPKPGQTFIGRAGMLIKPGDAVYWDSATNTVCANGVIGEARQGVVDTIALDSQEARDMAQVDAAREKPNGH